MENKKAQLEWIICIGLVIIIFLVIGTFTGIHIITTRDGTHTGYVTSIEENGIIFKTITVYFKTETESSQEDAYCLIDRSLIPKLTEKQINKEKVTIKFFDYLMPSFSECGKGEGIISGVN